MSKGDAIKRDTSAAGSTAYNSASAVVQASQPIASSSETCRNIFYGELFRW